MPLYAPFHQAFFEGATSTVDIVGKWHAALNGRTYLLDLASEQFQHYSIPLVRNQADTGDSPSESSINPDDLWRRSQDSWHKGAGQSFYDRGDSDPERFNTSKGVDVWTKWQLSLLHDTDQKKSSANTNLLLCVAGSYLYLTDGTSIQYTQDVTVDSPTWTDITGEPAGAATSIASDGYNVWTSHTANGIYGTTRGAASTTQLISDPVTLVAYVKGRVMAAYTNSIYNVIDFTTPPNALPTALLTHPNTDFTWVGFAEGPAHIYAAGYSGDKSLIYKTSIKADGTALDVPTVAGELPDGEIVRAVQGYLGFLVIGTDKGLRFAEIDSNGNLTIGSLIPTGAAVKCFEPQDRFVWYGLTNYDSTSTGLGRLDLSTLTAPLTPAYASDLMVTGQGAVLSCVTFNSRRVFTVSGLGVYGETSTVVSSGMLDTGQITYRLPDDKVAMFIDVRHDKVGSHSVLLSSNGGTFTMLGSAHTTSDDPFLANQSRASRFELRLTLTAVSSVGPVIRAVTLRAYPTANTVTYIRAPLLLADQLKTLAGQDFISDPAVELAAVKELRESRELVTWQEGDTSYQVIVENFEWHPHHLTKNGKAWNGTCITEMKEIRT